MKGIEKCLYPTTGIDGGPYRPVFQINQLPNIINVGICTIRKHRPASGEPEPVSLEPDPILVFLFHRQMLVRHVSEPHRVPTLRPTERRLVTVGRWDSALEHLAGLRAVPLPVHQHIPVELQGPHGVLARGILGELGLAGRDVINTRRSRRWVGGLVVGREVKGDD